MEKLLSIIIPVFKAECYIDRCIKSIVSQTYSSLEIILVDDGSPDNSPQICDNWSKRDSRIKVIHKENGGAASARNIGIENAHGELITFVDADDFLKLEMYEKMIECLTVTNSDVVCCGRYIKTMKEEIELLNLPLKKVFSSSEAIGELLKKGCIDEAAWDKVYKRSLFEKIKFPLYEVNEEVMPMLQIFDLAKSISHVGESYYYYWQTKDGVTKSAYGKKQTIVLKHIEQAEKYIFQNHKELLFELSCFKARYSLDMLENMVRSGKNIIAKYRSDYDAYFKLLRDNKWALLKSDSFGIYFKIKGVLMIFRLYSPVRQIMKGWKFFAKDYKS